MVILLIINTLYITFTWGILAASPHYADWGHSEDILSRIIQHKWLIYS